MRRTIAKADQSEPDGRHQFEVRARVDPAGQLPRESNMLPDQLPKAVDAVTPHDEPELESAEPASQRDSPIPEVGHLRVLGRTQVFRRDLKGAEQCFPVAQEVSTAIEVD